MSESKARPFGQYSTGLLVASGKDKVAAKTYVAGLFAQKRSKGRVLLFGRLRLGAGTKTITVQRLVPRRLVEEDRHAEDRRPLVVHAGRSRTSRARSTGSATRPPRGPRTTSIAIKPVPADS